MKLRAYAVVAALFLASTLLPLIPVAKAADNLVPNPSVEISIEAENRPESWNTGSLWGDLDATYQYPVSGYNSTRAVKATVTRYQSGDAKWYFSPQTVSPNQTYQFSDYYIASTSTRIVAMIEGAAGNVSYIEIGNVATASTWTQFSTTFVTPGDAQRVSIFHVIASVGSLTTDNFSLALVSGPSPTFDRGLVSVTFDDGWSSIYQNGLPLLEQYGIKSTQYVVTDFINKPGYMTLNQVRDFYSRGHQIASHTVHHYDLTTLNRKKLINELSQSKAYLQQNVGSPVLDMAAPYGAYNDTTITQVKRYYRSHRTSDEGYNAKSGFDVYKIRSQHITPSTTLTQFQGWLNSAHDQKVWLVLMYHNVDSSGSAYSVTPAMLSAQLQAIQNSGLTAKTVSQALDELTAQL